MKKALFIVFLLGFSYLFAYEPVVREFDVWDRGGLFNLLWCAVTVKDSDNFVRGLKLEDFKVSETAYDEKGEVITEKPIDFDNMYYQFDGDGFWEKSVNSEKLDIVFLIDNTGSMEKHITSIKEQLHSFLDRLIENGTDFRIVIAGYSVEDEPEWTSGLDDDRFFGPTMIKEIREAVDQITTAGEGWDLTWAYDAFLWTLNLDWREDARKIVVIITDVYTDSVYGPNWYFTSGCNTSMYAVDLALRETGMYLYYCQPEEENMAEIELLECYSPQVNTKVKDSNFDVLAQKNGQVKRLSWPFDQREIQLKNLSVIDSKYYFAWISNWSEYDFVSKVEVKITLTRTGDSASFVFCPLKNPDGTDANQYSDDINFIVKDEAGRSMLGSNNVDIYFYKVMGELDRMESITGTSDTNGIANLDNRQIGKYYYILYGSGCPPDRYHRLHYTGTGWVEIGPLNATPTEITAYTYGKSAELYKSLGLVKELENLEISTPKLKSYATAIREWLNDLEENGLVPVEMEAVKRFNNALAAMINCAAYACAVQSRASEDTQHIVEKAVNMVRKAEEVVEKLESAKHVILEIVNTFIDVITGNWSGIAANVTIEQLVDRVVNYVKDELVNDIMKAVEEKLTEVIRDPEAILGYFRTNIEEWIRQKISPQQISENVQDFVSNELVYKRFTLQLEEQLEKLLVYSRQFVEENYDKYWNLDERSKLIETSLEEMRDNLMEDLFELSYKALTDQEAIDDWGSALVIFQKTIPLIIEFLELFEVRYPQLTEIKEALQTLDSAFDAIGTLTKTYEVALKVDHLRPLSERVQQIADSVYQYK